MSVTPPESDQLVDKLPAKSDASTNPEPSATLEQSTDNQQKETVEKDSDEANIDKKDSSENSDEDQESSTSAETELSGNLGCAAFFLSLGISCLAIPVAQFLLPAPEQARSLNRWGIVSLTVGTPIVAGSVWGLVDSWLSAKAARRERLRHTFYELVEQHEGQISVWTFSREADISGQEAKDFLNECAQEFNGTFELGENGGINYLFEIGPT